MDALFIIYLSSNSKGEGVQVLSNSHQALTMHSSDHVIDPTPGRGHGLVSARVLCEKHKN